MRDILKSMRDILDTIFNGSAMLAPMLATSDIPFRKICREFGAGLVHTEMVSTLGISRASGEAHRHAVFDPSERPVAVQLVAADPDSVAYAIRVLMPLQPTVFDLNCGCPDQRICDAGAGAALLDDPKLFGAVIRAATTASPVPVSVKMRAHGHHRGNDVTANARIAEDNGADYITVHARPRSTPYDQPAQWDHIAHAKQAVRIPVVGNGDIFTAADARRMREQTGCDAVMIARGCLGSPWIFSQIRNGSEDGSIPEQGAILDLALRHTAMIEKEFGPIKSVPRIRKHILWYTRHFADNESLRRAIFLTDHPSAIRQAVEAYFLAGPAPVEPGSAIATEREWSFRRRVLYWMDGAEVVA